MARSPFIELELPFFPLPPSSLSLSFGKRLDSPNRRQTSPHIHPRLPSLPFVPTSSSTHQSSALVLLVIISSVVRTPSSSVRPRARGGMREGGSNREEEERARSSSRSARYGGGLVSAKMGRGGRKVGRERLTFGRDLDPPEREWKDLKTSSQKIHVRGV